MEEIGRYHILRKLGRGGMGFVYKALDPESDQIVAIKILHPFEALIDLLGMAKLREIFTFEAETMARLHHPAITGLLSFAEDRDSTPFLVMEFFCNNLGKMIGEDPGVEKKSRLIKPDKVLDYGQQLLEGLVYLEQNRIVHRDLKPANILISDDDTVKICDFGMALVGDGSFQVPDSLRIGSPFYAAPEQRRNQGMVDGRADLYAVGVILYRLLAGELPVPGAGRPTGAISLPDQAWDDFFVTALNPEPANRFQSGRLMLEALRKLARNQDSHSPPPADPDARQPSSFTILRKDPVNVCSNKAPEVFGLDLFSRPEIKVVNQFIGEAEKTVRDLATGLVWQAEGSRTAMTWPEGKAYIADLNANLFGDRDDWRLPTTNELFSLGNENCRRLWFSPAVPRSGWFWSSDIHGKRDVWYVNLEMGYTDWQDANCRNFVRAVA